MKAIVVEDNPSAVNLLKAHLKEYPEPIEIVGTTATVDGAAKLIRRHKPELWFLDVELEDHPVFGLFQSLDDEVVTRASIIFITAFYNADYMHAAIKNNAVDYINKPIDRKELFAAIEKAQKKIGSSVLSERLDKLEQTVHKIERRGPADKVSIFRSAGKIDFIYTHDIIYISSDSTLTKVHLLNGDFITSTKTLKFYEDLLDHNRFFFRASKKHLINLEHVVSYDPQAKTVHFFNKDCISVSRRSSTELQDYFRAR